MLVTALEFTALDLILFRKWDAWPFPEAKVRVQGILEYGWITKYLFICFSFFLSVINDFNFELQSAQGSGQNKRNNWGMHSQIFYSAQRIFFAHKKDPSGRTKYEYAKPPQLLHLHLALHDILVGLDWKYNSADSEGQK